MPPQFSKFSCPTPFGELSFVKNEEKTFYEAMIPQTDKIISLPTNIENCAGNFKSVILKYSEKFNHILSSLDKMKTKDCSTENILEIVKKSIEELNAKIKNTNNHLSIT